MVMIKQKVRSRSNEGMLSWYGIWITEYGTWNRGEESRDGMLGFPSGMDPVCPLPSTNHTKDGAKTARPLVRVRGSVAPQTSRLENGDWARDACDHADDKASKR